MSKIRKKREPVPEDKLRMLASSPNGSLFYEMKMLNEAAPQCEETLEPIPELRFMAIESFLIHYRNLRDFLYPDEKVKGEIDNVIAFDYDPNWVKTREDWTPCSDDEQSRINKMLAHISYSRHGLDPGWDTRKMLRCMMNGLREFIRNLPAERQKWFEEWAGYFEAKAVLFFGDREEGAKFQQRHPLWAERFDSRAGAVFFARKDEP